jgi:sigma-B regulation protein RsbU (phosphoserine phosphatase)
MKGTKKRSIKNKVFRLMIITAFISMAAVSVLAITETLYLRTNTVSVYSEISASISNDSMNAFDRMSGVSAEKLIIKRAETADAKLSSWQSNAEMLAAAAEDIINNPEYYNPYPFDMDKMWLWHNQNAISNDYIKEAELMGNIYGILTGIVDCNDNMTGAYIGSEQGYFITTTRPLNESESYDPRQRSWYEAAKEAGGAAWTDVYEDYAGYGLTVTCAAPFYKRDDRTLAGVAGVDAFLNDLSFIINEGRSWDSEVSFILNERGETLISGGASDVTAWDDIWQFIINNDITADIVSDISDRKTGTGKISCYDANGEIKIFLIAYTGLKTLPWNIVTLIDFNEIYAPTDVMMKNISGMTQLLVNNINGVIIRLIGVFSGIFIIIASVIWFIAQKFSHSLTKPITTLQTSVGLIAQGDLSHRVSVDTKDEIEDLGHSVNKMTADLREYIQNLQTVTAEKERIGAELDVATKIQASMLPYIFPAFPERTEFDIYASMQPAKEVGGDFYDFFLIDVNTLAVVIADVSGKGVPAALFMVIAKTLIKNNAQTGKNPKEVFETVNNILNENNDADMFVTAILGYFDIRTGKFAFVNAGHNHPLLYTNGRFDWLKVKTSFVLAGMEDMLYKLYEITLKPGDELFLYTDGVTEAVNNEYKLFGDQRLFETVNNYANSPLREFTVSIKREIDKFAEGAEQADDITMLALRYKGYKHE